jgi:hypothetical protein
MSERPVGLVRRAAAARPPAVVVDVPPGPGLGIEVDEDAVRGHELDGYHLDSARSARLPPGGRLGSWIT